MTPRVCASLLAGVMVMLLPAASSAQQAAGLLPLRIAGDAIPESLTGVPGNAERGRLIVASRQTGLCLLCHAGPLPEERFQGNLAPDLAGAGSRWSEGQLRLRVADARRLNPQTLMPAYYQTEGLDRVGAAWQGQPLLAAQQIEDVVAFLRTLRN